MSVKSPGGSIYPYFYKDGEIHCLKYGGFHGDEPGLFALMDAEEGFIRQRKQRLFRLWVDLYETEVSEAVAERLARQAAALGGQVVKLAYVGCTAGERNRIKKCLKKAGVKPGIVAFYDDPEDAKTWLVSGIIC
jgi:hypothetical protein